MRKHILAFVHRGLAALGFGPLVLAIFYLILQKQGLAEVLTVREVCLGIFSLSALAFIAGGMNFIYQLERLPLMAAVSIHGAVLYVSYLATYLVNGWLALGTMPILVFSAIFILGYLVIWAIIYLIIKRKTAQVNELLKKQRIHKSE